MSCKKIEEGNNKLGRGEQGLKFESLCWDICVGVKLESCLLRLGCQWWIFINLWRKTRKERSVNMKFKNGWLCKYMPHFAHSFRLLTVWWPVSTAFLFCFFRVQKYHWQFHKVYHLWFLNSVTLNNTQNFYIFKAW